MALSNAERQRRFRQRQRQKARVADPLRTIRQCYVEDAIEFRESHGYGHTDDEQSTAEDDANEALVDLARAFEYHLHMNFDHIEGERGERYRAALRQAIATLRGEG